MATLTRLASPTLPAVGEVTVFASRLPLNSRLAAPRFLLDTLRIKRELDRLIDAPDGGLCWYALRADLRANVYWTASAWSNPSALSSFVRAEPHVGIMRSLRGKLGQFDSTRWQIGADALPLDHAEISRALRAGCRASHSPH